MIDVLTGSVPLTVCKL